MFDGNGNGFGETSLVAISLFPPGRRSGTAVCRPTSEIVSASSPSPVALVTLSLSLFVSAGSSRRCYGPPFLRYSQAADVLAVRAGEFIFWHFPCGTIGFVEWQRTGRTSLGERGLLHSWFWRLSQQLRCNSRLRSSECSYSFNWIRFLVMVDLVGIRDKQIPANRAST